MSEWWTYRPSDFLMFAPRTYYRLIELYNAAVWPAQLVALAAGATLLVLAWRGRAASPRWVFGLLAFAWAWVGVVFHGRHFVTINWAASWFAGAFLLQALLWIGLAVRHAGLQWRSDAGSRRLVGLGLIAAAVLLFPLLAPATGRSWRQAELFGLAPDPTVLATLGVLLLLDGARWLRLICSVLPLGWCVFAVLLQWTMHAP
ncbi:hypothetical protein HLB44_01695 [Aquincola sp. S2]|uniref:MFS transporter permease n=1 Tax=Pseudaquabacterium terrae TaxID=2732868 RepID=A0ABX2E9J7_9BURK|nr:DUF6064 family protein [Aquabacterium terrae]NRF65689.1 hypothetical protein [Aquabacterium terrae]